MFSLFALFSLDFVGTDWLQGPKKEIVRTLQAIKTGQARSKLQQAAQILCCGLSIRNFLRWFYDLVMMKIQNQAKKVCKFVINLR